MITDEERKQIWDALKYYFREFQKRYHTVLPQHSRLDFAVSMMCISEDGTYGSEYTIRQLVNVPPIPSRSSVLLRLALIDYQKLLGPVTKYLSCVGTDFDRELIVAEIRDLGASLSAKKP